MKASPTEKEIGVFLFVSLPDMCFFCGSLRCQMKHCYILHLPIPLRQKKSVLLYYCTAVPLYHCTIVPLYHCTTPVLQILHVPLQNHSVSGKESLEMLVSGKESLEMSVSSKES